MVHCSNVIVLYVLVIFLYGVVRDDYFIIISKLCVSHWLNLSDYVVSVVVINIHSDVGRCSFSEN